MRESQGLSGVCWSPLPAGLCRAAYTDCKQITCAEHERAQEEQEVQSHK